MKCLTCLRGASGGRLLAYGLQLVCSEQVGVLLVQTLEGGVTNKFVGRHLGRSL